MESIIKLADSIRRYGILQPLSVRRVPKEAPAAPSRRKKNIVADILSASVGAEVEKEAAADDKPSGVYVSRETVVEQARQLVLPGDLPLLGSEIDGKMWENQELPLVCDEKIVYSPLNAPVFLPDDTCAYELIAGERRLRAAKMLGMSHVPCIIVDVDEAVSAELALVENMLRENLNMFEQAAAFSRLSRKFNLTQEEIAEKMSLSQSAVANKIRLLRLSDAEQQAILEADLSERHARALLRIPDESLRTECLDVIINRKLNVAETDQYITSILVKRPEPPKTQSPTPEKLCTNIYKFINRMQVAS